MKAVLEYFDLLEEKLNLLKENYEVIEKAADLIMESHDQGGHFYAFGTGHSHMIVEELYTRAGGLAFTKAILPPEMMLHEMVNKSTNLERLPGYAKALLDLYPLNEKDVILIISNSGRNSVPVEMALEAKKRGAKVIAMTSLKHSKEVNARTLSGLKLYEVADLVIDNQAAYGDAEYRFKDTNVPLAGTSDFSGIALVQALTVCIGQRFYERGEQIPVFLSGNVDGSEKWNQALSKKYS